MTCNFVSVLSFNHIGVFPIPIGYQELGGNARALMLTPEMKFLEEEIFEAIISNDLVWPPIIEEGGDVKAIGPGLLSSYGEMEHACTGGAFCGKEEACVCEPNLEYRKYELSPPSKPTVPHI